MTPIRAALLSGLAWSAVAAGIVAGTDYDQTGLGLAATLAAGVAIGPAVYLGSRWAYVRGKAVRALWAVASLYLAALASGAVAGVVGTGSLDAFWLGAIWCWGLTLLPPFQALFVFAFVNHEWLRAEHLDARAAASAV